MYYKTEVCHFSEQQRERDLFFFFFVPCGQKFKPKHAEDSQVDWS